MTATTDTRPLTILGATAEGSVAFRLGEHDEVLELDESELTSLLKALHDDYLPLFPFEPCESCDDGRNSVAFVDGRYLCEAHAAGWLAAEDEAEGDR